MEEISFPLNFILEGCSQLIHDLSNGAGRQDSEKVLNFPHLADMAKPIKLAQNGRDSQVKSYYDGDGTTQSKASKTILEAINSSIMNCSVNSEKKPELGFFQNNSGGNDVAVAPSRTNDTVRVNGEDKASIECAIENKKTNNKQSQVERAMDKNFGKEVRTRTAVGASDTQSNKLSKNNSSIDRLNFSFNAQNGAARAADDTPQHGLSAINNLPDAVLEANARIENIDVDRLALETAKRVLIRILPMILKEKTQNQGASSELKADQQDERLVIDTSDGVFSENGRAENFHRKLDQSNSSFTEKNSTDESGVYFSFDDLSTYSDGMQLLPLGLELDEEKSGKDKTFSHFKSPILQDRAQSKGFGYSIGNMLGSTLSRGETISDGTQGIRENNQMHGKKLKNVNFAGIPLESLTNSNEEGKNSNEVGKLSDSNLEAKLNYLNENKHENSGNSSIFGPSVNSITHFSLSKSKSKEIPTPTIGKVAFEQQGTSLKDGHDIFHLPLSSKSQRVDKSDNPSSVTDQIYREAEPTHGYYNPAVNETSHHDSDNVRLFSKANLEKNKVFGIPTVSGSVYAGGNDESELYIPMFSRAVGKRPKGPNLISVAPGIESKGSKTTNGQNDSNFHQLTESSRQPAPDRQGLLETAADSNDRYPDSSFKIHNLAQIELEHRILPTRISDLGRKVEHRSAVLAAKDKAHVKISNSKFVPKLLKSDNTTVFKRWMSKSDSLMDHCQLDEASNFAAADDIQSDKTSHFNQELRIGQKNIFSPQNDNSRDHLQGSERKNLPVQHLIKSQVSVVPSVEGDQYTKMDGAAPSGPTSELKHELHLDQDKQKFWMGENFSKIFENGETSRSRINLLSNLNQIVLDKVPNTVKTRSTIYFGYPWSKVTTHNKATFSAAENRDNASGYFVDERNVAGPKLTMAHSTRFETPHLKKRLVAYLPVNLTVDDIMLNDTRKKFSRASTRKLQSRRNVRWPDAVPSEIEGNGPATKKQFKKEEITEDYVKDEELEGEKEQEEGNSASLDRTQLDERLSVEVGENSSNFSPSKILGTKSDNSVQIREDNSARKCWRCQGNHDRPFRPESYENRNKYIESNKKNSLKGLKGQKKGDQGGELNMKPHYGQLIKLGEVEYQKNKKTDHLAPTISKNIVEYKKSEKKEFASRNRLNKSGSKLPIQKYLQKGNAKNENNLHAIGFDRETKPMMGKRGTPMDKWTKIDDKKAKKEESITEKEKYDDELGISRFNHLHSQIDKTEDPARQCIAEGSFDQSETSIDTTLDDRDRSFEINFKHETEQENEIADEPSDTSEKMDSTEKLNGIPGNMRSVVQEDTDQNRNAHDTDSQVASDGDVDTKTSVAIINSGHPDTGIKISHVTTQAGPVQSNETEIKNEKDNEEMETQIEHVNGTELGRTNVTEKPKKNLAKSFIDSNKDSKINECLGDMQDAENVTPISAVTANTLQQETIDALPDDIPAENMLTKTQDTKSGHNSASDDQKNDDLGARDMNGDATAIGNSGISEAQEKKIFGRLVPGVPLKEIESNANNRVVKDNRATRQTSGKGTVNIRSPRTNGFYQRTTNMDEMKKDPSYYYDNPVPAPMMMQRTDIEPPLLPMAAHLGPPSSAQLAGYAAPYQAAGQIYPLQFIGSSVENDVIPCNSGFCPGTTQNLVPAPSFTNMAWNRRRSMTNNLKSRVFQLPTFPKNENPVNNLYIGNWNNSSDWFPPLKVLDRNLSGGTFHYSVGEQQNGKKILPWPQQGEKIVPMAHRMRVWKNPPIQLTYSGMLNTSVPPLTHFRGGNRTNSGPYVDENESAFVNDFSESIAPSRNVLKRNIAMQAIDLSHVRGLYSLAPPRLRPTFYNN